MFRDCIEMMVYLLCLLSAFVDDCEVMHVSRLHRDDGVFALFVIGVC